MPATAGARRKSRSAKAWLWTEGHDHDRTFLRLLHHTSHRRADLHRARRFLAHLHALHRWHSGLRHPSPHGRRRRQLPAACGALLHSRRQSHELSRHHEPHLRLRGGARRLAQGGPRSRECRRLGDLCRHVRHRRRRRGWPRYDRDQGHARSWLQDRLRRRRNCGILNDRADHSAVAAHGHLRRDGERVDRAALRRGVPSRLADGCLSHDVRDVVRASLQHRP